MSPSLTEPEAKLSHLPRADGSVTFSYAGYTVIASVNGPLEASRRDENPSEASIDVIVRPATGVGGTSERHLESILKSTLRQIITVQNFPRSVIQITLQITEVPENDYAYTKTNQAQINIPIIPALLHTSILGLLASAVPLKGIVTSTLLAIPQQGTKIIVDPSPLEISSAKSIHVLAFTSQDELIVAESEGAFTVAEWEEVVALGRKVCCRDSAGSVDATMTDGDDADELPNMRHFIRSVLASKTTADLHWKLGL